MEKTTPLSDIAHSLSIPTLPAIVGLASGMVFPLFGLGANLFPATWLISDLQMLPENAGILSVLFYSMITYLVVTYGVFKNFMPNNHSDDWTYISRVSSHCFSKGRSYATTVSYVYKELDKGGHTYNKKDVNNEVEAYLYQRGWLVLLKDRGPV